MYSLTIGDTETFIQYPLDFNPFANQATPRIATQKMIAGTNYQDSGIHHSDGKFIISGQWLKPEVQEAFFAEYNGQRRPMVFTSYLKTEPEKWQVIFGPFIPWPHEVKYENIPIWSMELLILGKYDPETGELMK